VCDLISPVCVFIIFSGSVKLVGQSFITGLQCRIIWHANELRRILREEHTNPKFQPQRHKLEILFKYGNGKQSNKYVAIII
jgi:hypothetical protein